MFFIIYKTRSDHHINAVKIGCYKIEMYFIICVINLYLFVKKVLSIIDI